MGNVVAMLATHRHAVELDPENLMVVFHLSVTLDEEDVDIDKAISAYVGALTLDVAG